MGTRADYYVGRGKDAEWLGSTAWDGYPDGGGVGTHLPFACADERVWRAAVAKMLSERDDGTKPEDGWPWPWEDSGTTDYAYAFDGGKVWCYGYRWFPADGPVPDEDDEGEEHEAAVFPHMGRCTDPEQLFGKDSGLIVIKNGGAK